MVHITDRAKEKIQEILNQNRGKYVRLFIQGMHCGGPTMGLALDEPKENEQPVDVTGIDVLIEDFVRPLADGTTIDYVNHSHGEGFTIVESRELC